MVWWPILAHTITLPPLCCRFVLLGASSPSRAHPWAHPSGPPNVARVSSVSVTFLKSIFMYILAHFTRLVTFANEIGGWEEDFLTEEIWRSILHFLSRFTSPLPAISNISRLLSKGFLRTYRLRSRVSQEKMFLYTFTDLGLRVLFIFSTIFLIMRWSFTSSLASTVALPSLNSLVIFFAILRL